MSPRRQPACVPLAVTCAALLAGLAAGAARAADPGAPAASAPARYALDPVHTRVQFTVDHAGYSRAIGTVSGSTGTITFAPGDWRVARLDVAVPLQRLDLGDDAWERAAIGILDADAHPRALFTSTRVEPVGPWAARVCGDLTLHGTTRDFCLHVQFNQLARYPLPPFHRVAGFSASGHLRRSDFGIDSWPSVIGDVVELRIEAEARLVGPASAAAQGDG